MRSKRESEFSEGGCKERREREERDVRGGERELVVESGWTSEGELDQHSVLEVVKLPKRKKLTIISLSCSLILRILSNSTLLIQSSQELESAVIPRRR